MTVWAPIDKEPTTHAAWPAPFKATFWQAETAFAPSKKLTLPVGTPNGGGAVTVAVNVTLWPNTEGFADDPTAITVAGVGVSVGVAVGVLVGVAVGVAVGVLVGVAVGVFVGVAVGVFVGVVVGVSVGVAVGVLVGVAVGVFVGVAVGVAVGVLVGVAVGVFVGVVVGVFVGVGVGTVPVGKNSDVLFSPSVADEVIRSPLVQPRSKARPKLMDFAPPEGPEWSNSV